MNWSLLGHEWAVELLSQHVAQGQVRHAYLLTGPQGVGRRTLALRLAQALNCPQPTTPGQPCLKCSTCQRIQKMAYTDLSVVQAEVAGGTLKVEQVRELQHSLSLAPYEGRYRVALLLRFEEAHPSAANALLKTLEEPSPQVVLVLTAESAESLLPTIVSRCEVLRLRPVSQDNLAAGLQTVYGLEAERAKLLAHLSAGRPGAALRLHANPAEMEQRQEWLDDLYRLIAASRVKRFTYIEPLARKKEEKEKLYNILLTWLSFWRDIMLKTSGAEAAVVNLDWEPEIEAIASQLSVASAREAVRAIERMLEQLDRNINTRLAGEVLMLDMPRLEGLGELKESANPRQSTRI
jgi:DNA polymerase III subunit delta'